MSSGPEVPGLWAWLAGVSAPPPDRGSLLGDLEERFRGRARSRGGRSARWWYRGQALRLLLVLGPRRVFGALPRVVAPGTARAALRSLLQAPLASLAAAATIGAGIAAPVAMFALADGVTASLPGDADDRVVRVSEVDREGRVRMGFPWSVVEAWSAGAAGAGRALDALAAFRSDGPVAVAGGGTAAGRYRGVYATSALFRLLDVGPVVGRLYGNDEPAGLPEVLIREDVWEARFDRSQEALGAVLRIDAVDHVVVGVLPRDFGFPIDHRLWMQPVDGRDGAWSVAGRLAPGASVGVAREQLAAVMAAIGPAADGPARKASPDELAVVDPADGLGADDPSATALQVERHTEAHWSVDGNDERTRRIGMLSLILVLVAAVNVAALMVARSVSRSRETAVRMALGASRSQVMSLTLTEGLFLAVVGCIFGLGLGYAALQVMVRYLTGQATIVPYWMDFQLGSRSVVLAAVLGLLALAVAAVLPALHASRTDLDRTLRHRPHGGAGDAAHLMRWVVGLEVTLTCFLLAVSSVVVDEALSQLRTGADFATEGIMTGRFVLEPPDYEGVAARRAFFSRLGADLEAEPSVHTASLTSALPGAEGLLVPSGVVGPEVDPDRLHPARSRSIDPAFFPLVGASIVAGRPFSDADDATSEPVAIVNQAYAEREGGGADILGRRIVIGAPGRGDAVREGEGYTVTVVGVVDDRGITPHARGQPAPGMYVPIQQVPPPVTWVLVRSRDGTPLFEVWHQAVATLDPYLPLDEVLSLEETLRRGHGAATLFMSVFLALGSATLLVALVGLHGVQAFSLARRAPEIGLRRALGAGRWQVLREGMSRGLRPVWVGLLLGIVPGFLVAGAVVPVEPDVRIYLLVPALLVVASAVAIWHPTRRAAGADPMDVLGDG